MEAAVAMEHTDNAYNSLQRYFDILEHTGHYNARGTKNLVIYLFIVNHIFSGNLYKHLDDEGLAVFERALRCVYDGCLINAVRDNIKIKEEEPYQSIAKIRHSEALIPRISQEDITRIPEDMV